MLKILAGLIAKFDKVYVIAAFGAATEKLEKATVDGNLEQGVQFVGQSQGLINDVPTVLEMIERVVSEAKEQQSCSREVVEFKNALGIFKVLSSLNKKRGSLLLLL